MTNALLTIPNSAAYTTRARMATSRDRGWKGATLDLHGLVSNVELDTPPADHHAVAYCLNGAGKWWQRRGGKTHESVIRSGSVIVMSAGDSRSWRGTAPPSLRMRLPCSLVEDAAQQMGKDTGRSSELMDVFHTRDVFIGHIASIFVAELEAPANPAQSLVIESASYALAAHLVRKYDVFRRGEAHLTGLGPRALAAVLTYIDDNMHSSISLEELAAVAHVSRFHFARMFKLSVGVTPMRYVETCKIRKAQEMIKEGALSLMHIGRALGFADHSHFSRRFREHLGCTPSYYAANIVKRRVISH